MTLKTLLLINTEFFSKISSSIELSLCFLFIHAPLTSHQEPGSALPFECNFWIFSGIWILFICSGGRPPGPRWRCCPAPPRWWSAWWRWHASCFGGASACSWLGWRLVWSSWLSASWWGGCWVLCCLFMTAVSDPGDPIFIISPPPTPLHRSPDTPALGSLVKTPFCSQNL